MDREISYEQDSKAAENDDLSLQQAKTKVFLK